MTSANNSGRAKHPILWTLGILVLVGALFAAYLAFGPGPTAFAKGTRVALDKYSGADPTGVPAELKAAGLVQRGEYLTRAADCQACHTSQDGIPFAGGRPFVLPFGTIYSTNITPDPATGIGGYTDAEFLNALHKGIGRGNKRLYPAMPYASYTYMADADALAIKAYLFSLQPVNAAAPANTLIFPLSQRGLMSVWSGMFNPDKRYEPNTERDALWNRGAYLTEAMGHCGECHTPRNLGFALNNRQKFSGAVQAGWRAYNITPDKSSGIGEWSDEDLLHYLSSGHTAGRGAASGPMGQAIDDSLSYLTARDLTAIVSYLRTVVGITTSDLPTPRATPAPPAFADLSTEPRGRAVYESACVGCHGWTGISPGNNVASLIGARSINDATAINVVQVVVHGGERQAPAGPSNMPAFGSTYSDAEIAGVANYVTARFGTQGSRVTAAEVAKLRTQE